MVTATALAAINPAASGQIVTWPRGQPLPNATERRVPVDDYAANLDGLIRDARERGIGVEAFAQRQRLHAIVFAIVLLNYCR